MVAEAPGGANSSANFSDIPFPGLPRGERILQVIRLHMFSTTSLRNTRACFRRLTFRHTCGSDAGDVSTRADADATTFAPSPPPLAGRQLISLRWPCEGRSCARNLRAPGDSARRSTSRRTYSPAESSDESSQSRALPVQKMTLPSEGGGSQRQLKRGGTQCSLCLLEADTT